MSLVLERPFELDYVLLVLRVGRVQLLEDGDLGEAALSQSVVVAHDLDGDELLVGDVDGSHHAREHALAERRLDLVATVHDLTWPQLVVAILIITLLVTPAIG